MYKINEIRYNLKSPKSTKRTLIYLVFRYGPKENRKRLKYSTGLHVDPKHWSKKDQKVKNLNIDGSQKTRLNIVSDGLKELREHCESIYNDHGDIETLHFKELLDVRFKGKRVRPSEDDKRPKSFLEFIDLYIKEGKSRPDSRRGTWKVWVTAKNHIHAYSKLYGYYDSKAEKPTIKYEDFTMGWRNEFVNEYMYKYKKQSINFTAKIISVINQFINEANDRDLPQYWGCEPITHHKKKGWLVKKTKTLKFRLTFAELESMYNQKLSGRMEIARDLFLIGAYSGLRYSDFSRLKPHHLVEEKGVKIIEIITQKTTTTVAVPCILHLENLLSKYDFRLPKMINQEMNRCLKKIGKAAGIDKKIVSNETQGGINNNEVEYKAYEKLTTHVARRSFCSNFYELGIPAAKLMLISGHSTERQFFNYICIEGRYNAIELAKEINMKMNEEAKMKVV